MRISITDKDTYTWNDFHFAGLSGRQYVVLDLEATGADWQTDSITQIGAVKVRDSSPVDRESFSRLVKPWKPIPEKIERLTGVTNKATGSAEDFATVYEVFRAFCSDCVLVGQCSYTFDFLLLERECERAGVSMLPNPRLDTKALFAYLHRDREDIFSTDFLSDYYGVDRTPFKRHDALGDALLISRILCAELKEAKSMGIDSVVVNDPIEIRLAVLLPLP
jgi:DNA polymerase-3 subunit epsilon